MVGSPSDRPFASLDEMEINATAFLSVPARQRDAWLFFLNYSNIREFLEDVPVVPGFGYAFRPSEEFSAVITTGIASIQYRPTEKLTLQASYIAIRTVDARIFYQIFRPVRLWVGFDWGSERYLRADRQDSDDRLFYHEKRVRVGAIIGLARELFIDVTGGYAFDRFYFEGEGYSDRDDNRIDVGDGPFAALRVGAEVLVGGRSLGRPPRPGLDRSEALASHSPHRPDTGPPRALVNREEEPCERSPDGAS